MPKAVPSGEEEYCAGFSTTDLRSDIPLANMGPFTSYYQRPKSTKISRRKILYVQSNCNAVFSGRGFVIKKLIERGLVDSFGECNNNIDFTDKFELVTNGRGENKTALMESYGVVTRGGNKTALIERYAFVAAFENLYYPGYVTEKLWEPLWYGSLPLYLGAPNARSILPEHSFINVDDFTTIDELADYIEYLIQNHTAYDLYHKWRGTDPPKRLAELWKFTHQSFDCRLCRWGAEHLY